MNVRRLLCVSLLTLVSLSTLMACSGKPAGQGASVPESGGSKLADFGGIDFAYPSSLAEGVFPAVIPAHTDSSGFVYDDLPAHIRFDFSSPYTTGGSFPGLQPGQIPWLRQQNVDGPEIQPLIFIFPTSAYAEMSQLAHERIGDLGGLLESNSLPTCGKIPVLPTFNAAQDLCAQLSPLAFQGGSGLRFVARYSQGVAPVANPDVFYTFQGLTDDGSLYVAAFFPLYVSILPDQTQVRDWDAFSLGYSEYMEGVASNIEQFDAEDFEPGLETLDLLIHSLTIDASGLPNEIAVQSNGNPG